MSAKAYSVKQIRKELDRLTAGGEMDRAATIRWLTLACEQLEDWQLAYYEVEHERTRFATQVSAMESLIGGVKIACDVIQRTCADELTSHAPLEWARDTAPFKNIMRTLYGLGPCGEELPKRKRRAKADA